MLTQKYIKLTPYAHINHYFSKEAVASQPFFGSLQALNQSFSNEAVLYVYIYSSATGRALKSDAEKNGQTYYWHYTTIEIDEQGNYYQTENGRSRTKIETIQITTSVGDGAVPVTNYCCISRIAFSDERIKELCVKLAESSGTYKRFEEIKIYEAAKSRNNYYVKVTEPMYVAQELSKKYQEDYERYIGWISEPQRMSLKRLNDMIVKVVEGNTKYASCLESGFKQNYINFNNPVLCPYTRWRDEYFRELEVLTTACNESCSILCQWLDGESFNLMLDDYLKDDASKDLGEKEFELCTKYVNQEKVGVEYLQKIVDDENHWVWKTVFQEIARAGIEATWSILYLFVTHKITKDGQRHSIGQYMTQYIIDTINRRHSGGYIWVINDDILEICTLDAAPRRIQISKLVATKNRTVLDLVNERQISTYFLIIVDGINIFLAIQDLNKNGYMRPENKALLAVSLSSLISDVIIVKKNLGNILSFSASAYFIGAIAGVVSASLSAFDVFDALEMNDFESATGHGIMAFGSVLGMVSSICYGVAIVSAGTGAALPEGLIVGIAGLLCSFAGWVVIQINADSGIESWLKNCIWGAYHERSDNYWYDWMSKLEIKRHLLNNNRVDVQVKILNNTIYSISCNTEKRTIQGIKSYKITANTQLLPQTKLYFCLWYLENGVPRKHFCIQLTNRNVWITKRDGANIIELELFLYDELTHVDDSLVKPIYIPELAAMKADAAGFFNILNDKTLRFLVIADIYGDGTEYIPPNPRLLMDLFETKKRNFHFPGMEQTFLLEA